MRWSEWWISEQEKWTLLWRLEASGIIPNTNHKRNTKSQNVNAGCVTILSGPHFTPPHPTGTPLCRETYARDNRAIHSENSLLFLLYIVSSLNKSTNYNGIWRRHFHIRITYFVSLFSEMFAARMRTRFFTRCDLQWCILQPWLVFHIVQSQQAVNWLHSLVDSRDTSGRALRAFPTNLGDAVMYFSTYASSTDGVTLIKFLVLLHPKPWSPSWRPIQPNACLRNDLQ